MPHCCNPGNPVLSVPGGPVRAPSLCPGPKPTANRDIALHHTIHVYTSPGLRLSTLHDRP